MKDEYKEMVCRVRFIDGVCVQAYLSDVEIVRCKDCKQSVINEVERFKGYLDEDMIYRIQTAVKRLPTVEAIPIHFIEEQILLWESLNEKTLPSFFYRELIELWKDKQNDKSTVERTGALD